jgi:hypothetical protein
LSLSKVRLTSFFDPALPFDAAGKARTMLCVSIRMHRIARGGGRRDGAAPVGPAASLLLVSGGLSGGRWRQRAELAAGPGQERYQAKWRNKAVRRAVRKAG